MTRPKTFVKNELSCFCKCKKTPIKSIVKLITKQQFHVPKIDAFLTTGVMSQIKANKP